MKLSDLQRHAIDKPQDLAIVEDGVEYSYRSFFNSVKFFMEYISENSLDNSRIFAILGSPLESWISIIALRNLGFDTICIKSVEILRELALKCPHYVCSFADDLSGGLHEYCRETGSVYVKPPKREDWRSDEIHFSPQQYVPESKIGGHIAYTSGTTGLFKKVYYTQEVFDSEVYQLNNEDCPVCHSLGYMPWTAAGAKFPLRIWKRGGTVIFDRRSDWPNHFFDYPIDFVCLISEYLRVICDSRVVQPAHFPELEVCMGGGFIQERFAFNFMERFNSKLYLAYGGTEFSTSLCTEIKNKEDLIWLDVIIPDYLEIVDENGKIVPENTEGRVRVKLYPWEPQEYYDDPVSTMNFYDNGYFYPGDLAVRRDDGKIRILGRVNDVLVFDGLKMAVGPLEELARQELGCTNVCLFTRQNDAGEECIIIVVEGAEFPDMEKIRFHSRHWERKFNEIRYLKIDKFPRNTNGMQKLNRKRILDLALEQIG